MCPTPPHASQFSSFALKPRPPQPDWPRVLTEWCVVRALDAAGFPESLGHTDEVRAAFVSEVCTYLRARTLEIPEAKAEEHGWTAAERVIAQTFGCEYDQAQSAHESSREDYFKALRQRKAAGGDLTAETPELIALQARMQRGEERLEELRREAEPAAGAARRRAMRAYWFANASRRIPEDIFMDAPRDGVIADLPWRFPTWWGGFVQKLGHFYTRCDPAYARLLQELPRLRAQAEQPRQVFVFSALVRQWRETNAERFGLLNDIHYPVVEQRAWVKYLTVQEWFDARARGYKHDPGVRQSAAERLYEALDKSPPDPRRTYWNN